MMTMAMASVTSPIRTSQQRGGQQDHGHQILELAREDFERPCFFCALQRVFPCSNSSFFACLAVSPDPFAF
jgi:hypothetical protein